MKLLNNQWSFFERKRTNNGDVSKTINILAYHPAWSLTWSFIISHTSPHCGRAGFYFLRTSKGKKRKSIFFHAGVNVPIIGNISINTQPTMPLANTKG